MHQWIAVGLIVALVIVGAMGNQTNQQGFAAVNSNTKVLQAVGDNQLEVNDGIQSLRQDVQDNQSETRDTLASMMSQIGKNTDAVVDLSKKVDNADRRLDRVETRLDGLETQGIMNAIVSSQRPAQEQRRVTLCQVADANGNPAGGQTYPCHQDSSGAWVAD